MYQIAGRIVDEDKQGAGFAADNVASISTPVFSRAGQFRGALTVSGLTTQFTAPVGDATIPMLERAAQTLGARMD